MLKKKLLREKRRKKERNLEDKDCSSNSDSDEDKQSKAKTVKSKVLIPFSSSPSAAPVKDRSPAVKDRSLTAKGGKSKKGKSSL